MIAESPLKTMDREQVEMTCLGKNEIQVKDYRGWTTISYLGFLYESRKIARLVGIWSVLVSMVQI